MQIDEGDVIGTIRDNHQYIAHYHTVPEMKLMKPKLNYNAIMK
jgi:hydroxypyruvate isomerase